MILFSTILFIKLLQRLFCFFAVLQIKSTIFLPIRIILYSIYQIILVPCCQHSKAPVESSLNKCLQFIQFLAIMHTSLVPLNHFISLVILFSSCYHNLITSLLIIIYIYCVICQYFFCIF